MRLLSEDEEDVYLDEGMQAEENIFSVDYDVWIDEVTGDINVIASFCAARITLEPNPVLGPTHSRPEKRSPATDVGSN